MEIYLDHLKGEREGALDRFSAGVIRVGRNPEFELCFEDLGVSYEHAELRRRDDGSFWVVDTGSTNGTYVNEERAHNTRLRDGDLLRFGKKGPTVRFRTSDGDPLLALRAKPPPPPRAAASPDAKPPPSAHDPPESAPKAPARPRVTNRYAALEEGVVASPSPSQGGERRAKTVGSRRSLAGALLAASVVLASTAVTVAFYLELEHRDEALGRALETSKVKDQEVARLKTAIDARLAEQKTQNEAALAEARLRADHAETELASERREARRIERESREKNADLERKLARAAGELAAMGQRATETGAWKVIQKRLSRSLVLILTSCEAVKKDGGRVPLNMFGTGFFVRRDGTIATNKHVVEPWKFRQLAQKLAQEGLSIDPKSCMCAAWTSGTRFLTDDRRFDLGTGYSTLRGTLERGRIAPDRWSALSLPGDSGPRLMKVHEDATNDDLALLRARGGPFEPVPLRRADAGPIEKLDNVMVLGFPAGAAILEKGMAEPSPSLGQVRKVEETIYVSASMIGGNSGGPLLDTEGRAIGIATRVVGGSEGLGTCLRIEHLIELLEGGTW